MLTALFLAASLQGHPFRPPAVPLVTHDPYFSIWSEADHAYDDVTRHWTHIPNDIGCNILVDGRMYRLRGRPTGTILPIDLPQANLVVTPTRSVYTYQNKKVRVVE